METKSKPSFLKIIYTPTLWPIYSPISKQYTVRIYMLSSFFCLENLRFFSLWYVLSFLTFFFNSSAKSVQKPLLLNLFRMVGLFEAAHRWWGGVAKRHPLSKISKICHTYPTLMKIDAVVITYRRLKKYRNPVTPLWVLLTSAFSLPEINNFCYISKYK